MLDKEFKGILLKELNEIQENIKRVLSEFKKTMWDMNEKFNTERL